MSERIGDNTCILKQRLCKAKHLRKDAENIKRGRTTSVILRLGKKYGKEGLILKNSVLENEATIKRGAYAACRKRQAKARAWTWQC
jgi:predicted secreted acid phosphatase